MQSHSLEILLRETAGRIVADLLRIETVLGAGAARRALGIHASVENQNRRLRIDEVDPMRYQVGQAIEAMAVYSFEHRKPVGMSLDVLKAETEQVEDFATSLSSDLFDMFRADHALTQDAGAAGWQAVPDLCRMTQARLNLDMGENLSLPELALLGNMNERSVRNALTAEGEDRLNPIDNPVQEHVTVGNDEARRWLRGRRGFHPTQYEEASAIAEEHPASIESVRELSGYILSRWQALGKTPESVGRDLQWPESRIEYLHAIVHTATQIDPRDCTILAQTLMVDEGWFTLQVMRNLFPDQIRLITTHTSRSLEMVRDDEPAESDRLCTRLCFVLHDATRLYPVRMKNRTTGKIAFRLSDGGKGGNLIDNTFETENVEEMIDLVCKQGKAVRLATTDGKRQGIYRSGKRSVRSVELDGKAC